MTGPGVPDPIELRVSGSMPVGAPAPPRLPMDLGLRAAVREGHLRLGDLDPFARLLATASLVVLLTSVAAVVGAGVWIAVSGIREADPFSWSARLGTAGFMAGLSILSATAVAYALAVPRRSSRGMVLAVAVVQVVVVAWDFVAAADLAEPVATPLRILAAAVLLLSLALAVAGVARPEGGLRSPWVRLLVGLAALPGLLHVIALALDGTLNGSAQAGLASTLAMGMATMTVTLSIALMPVVLWEAATWARASREELAAPIVRQVDRRPWILVALVGAKLAWLALGYLDRLPAALGGAAATWEQSAATSPVGWLLAALFAAACSAWLLRPTRGQIDERGLRPGIALVVAGFSAASVAGAAIGFVAPLLLVFGTSGPLQAAIGIAVWVGSQIQPTMFASAVLMPIAGVIAYRRGHRVAGVLLLVTAAWIAPRAFGIAGTFLGALPATGPLGFTVDLVTADAAMTVAVALLACAWATGAAHRLDPGALTLVLVVSTLMAHGGTLVPPLLVPALAVLAVTFPPLRELAVGSAELNEASAARTARVLGSLVRQGSVLLVAALTLLVAGAPRSSGVDELGRVLFAPPMAAMLVAATVSARAARRAVEVIPSGGAADALRASPVVHRRPPVRPAMAAGVAAVLLAGGATGLVVDPPLGWAWATPTPSPTGAPSDPAPAASPDPAVRAAALDGQVLLAMTGLEIGYREVQLSLSANAWDAAASNAASVHAAAQARLAELAAAGPGPACYDAALDAGRALLAAYGDAGATLRDAIMEAGSEDAAIAAISALGQARDAFRAAREAAGPECGASFDPWPFSGPAPAPTG